MRDNPVIGVASDTAHQAMWDPVLRKYVIFGRLGVGRVGRAESDDFVHWSQPHRVFAMDALDVSREKFYGMGASIYEGIYIGLPFVYHRDNSERIDIQLATSRDGITWKRAGNRQVFIPNGPEGSWDAGMIFMPNQPLQVVGDRVFIFYSGIQGNHVWNLRDYGKAGSPSYEKARHIGAAQIGVATIRRDGFVSLDAGADEGGGDHALIFVARGQAVARQHRRPQGTAGGRGAQHGR